EAAPENILSEHLRRVRFLQRPLDYPRPHFKFAADIDVGMVRADGKGADPDPFQHLVRISFDQLPVFERPRLALVRVAAEISGSRMVFRDEAPLHAGRKTGPPSSPQARLLDGVDQLGAGD